jgi:hypothetical protein
MTSAKNRLQQKIDSISEIEAAEALDFIEYLEQKRLRDLEDSLKNAPEDDEELTAEEKQALQEAEDDIKAGRVVDAEEVWKRLWL